MNDEPDDTSKKADDELSKREVDSAKKPMTPEEEKRDDKCKADALEVILNDQLKVSSEVELRRADGFRQRASWLLGFSGVILGLGASQADELLKDSRELGAFGHIAAPVALFLAFAAVAAAAVWSLQVLFVGRKGVPEFNEKEISEALDDKFLREGKFFNQHRIAQITQKQILARRINNGRSNTLLIRAFVALLVAVVLFIAQASVLLENTVEDHVCPYAIEAPGLAVSRGSQVKFADLRVFTHTVQIALKVPPCPGTEPVPE